MLTLLLETYSRVEVLSHSNGLQYKVRIPRHSSQSIGFLITLLEENRAPLKI